MTEFRSKSVGFLSLTLVGTEKAYTYMCTINKKDMNLKEIKEKYMGEGRKGGEGRNVILFSKQKHKITQRIISQTPPYTRVGVNTGVLCLRHPVHICI